MSEGTVNGTELTSQYFNQVTGDLERNTKEQERITAEIAALQQQLAALQHDHTVLEAMRQALGAPAGGADGIPAPVVSAVPSPRKKASAASGGRRQARKGAAAPPKNVKRPRKKAAAGEPAVKSARPSLVTLIDQHLAGQSEPRSAAEIAAALSQGHPNRDIQTKVVRTTLENLVARSRVQRTKQGSAVFYTGLGATEPTAVREAEAPSGAVE